MAAKYLFPLLIFSFVVWSCNESQTPQKKSIDEHAMIYQELLGIEHALLTKNYNHAISHSENLDKLLKEGYNLFCAGESAQIDGARLTNQILKQNLEKKKEYDLLDDLRMLKATIINLETDEDYDPYFAFLWKFEEEMYAATEVAIDPMLDLYEWNEFENMVACMNQTWQPVRLHFPSPEFLDFDEIKYKNQTVHKIYLENAMERFNKAVQNPDYEKNPICEAAEAVRLAYTEYIKSFIQMARGSDFILAKI